ncbi:dihydroneopterin aldolase [Chitinophaga polysaccharea]|uniref:dihydroneopterin aldolase n=1 Tax=Chitinophaga TaxID=79328 RepID=UPI001455AA0B|nr:MULTISPECIES: dihydroneopterin aldolase [Chitinophaga]NLR62155.1 dihydroneopterin aldolase [Chitinophaga polysaccharea]NLU95609.1 dihydroneopterin aldolase [Chitinophaga sp. Ak27]
MLTIALEQASFYAYHGLYPEETILGNYFMLDVAVRIPGTVPVDDLSETVNYQGIYEIAQTVMAVPRPLLEEVVYELSAALKQRYPTIQHSIVTLRKMNPPMGASIRNSLVSLEKDY